jgi:hypothetical protein
MWVHFETFHENFQPTYASKYPPAQSLFLALGWRLFGHPWYGVWLSGGLMCAALCWMLQGWLPPRYALLGGLMAVAQWGIAGNWINSYMGGSVAAAAGALVIGAVPRLVRRPTAGAAALAALGVVALANSRPYEGAVTAGTCAVAVLIWRRSTRQPVAQLFVWRLAAPPSFILGCGLLMMLYYNYRVTGHALLMPYALHQQQYGASPLFWIMPMGSTPAYHHDLLRRFWEQWDLSYYRRAHSFPPRVLLPFLSALRYFLTPISAIALFAAFLRGGRKVRVVLAIVAAVATAVLLERYTTPQYLAPATGALLLLVMFGVQSLQVKFGKRGLAAFAVLFFGVAAFQVSHLTADEYPHQAFNAQRLSVIHRLESEGRHHLVIVRYAPSHNVLEEWVYNHADIDASEIIWARDMGAAANRELLDYYRSRKAWVLDADATDPQPVPYGSR